MRLIKREGNRLFVQGSDFFDGTPILDIKGYRPQYRTDSYVMPDWFRTLADDKVTSKTSPPEDFAGLQISISFSPIVGRSII